MPHNSDAPQAEALAIKFESKGPENTNPNPEPQKPKRGRPRKTPSQGPTSDSRPSSEQQANQPKKRGRPPKVPAAPTAEMAANSSKATPSGSKHKGKSSAKALTPQANTLMKFLTPQTQAVADSDQKPDQAGPSVPQKEVSPFVEESKEPATDAPAQI